MTNNIWSLCLQSRELDKDKENKDRPLNKFKLIVLTNAVCVDILVWATKDENGEESFYVLSLEFSDTQ